MRDLPAINLSIIPTTLSFSISDSSPDDFLSKVRDSHHASSSPPLDLLVEQMRDRNVSRESLPITPPYLTLDGGSARGT